MASSHIRVTGIKATTVGMIQGTFLALVGIATAITFWLSQTIDFSNETDSVLRGLTFGLAQGILALIFVPIIYFAIGWVIGWLQGIILNAVVSLSGGLGVITETEE